MFIFLMFFSFYKGVIYVKKILVVEDEIAIAQILENFLISAGYSVELAHDGLAGLTKFKSGNFDLILLDVMLPKIDGYGLLEMIREVSQVPIIMITALDGEQNQIKAFELEVDDFITKPFMMDLVLKRIQAVLRRTSVIKQDEFVLIHNQIKLNSSSGEVFVNDKPISLTQKEYELLKLFLENPNRLFNREFLLERLWGYDYFGDPKIVNFHVQNLRKKLGGGEIETIRGVGYKLGRAT